ncbi:AcrR family transcriptional regulator [Deinococcus metalli]|uniref:AcrR family transcriptional regulator n=1 Tax=Deinococcus metalli TaxID=1141878 RepID=A0A7W8KMF6_9DEIO|nr:TetR/AcrR family transcriptional regulator [Deinococcus metalli]MBB5379304.1 AcrR family transcriptional regulator [Deinococcus metalli]GHF54605.1 TetR family transcriptional regulator [Deinococcus metalli]
MAGKRDEIIRATLRRFRSHSISRTTLKDVAEAAGLPLGNLYYYFKSRDELILSVLDECERELQTLLERLEPLEPVAWLAAYLDWLVETSQERDSLSCPFGSLATELRAVGDPAAIRAAEIVGRYRAAVGARTAALGASDPDALFLAVQGAHTVASILDDPALFEGAIDRLKNGPVT